MTLTYAITVSIFLSTKLIRTTATGCAKTKSCDKSSQSDGYCDDDNNVCSCGWDGGDCCGKSGQSGQYIFTQAQGFHVTVTSATPDPPALHGTPIPYHKPQAQPHSPTLKVAQTLITYPKLALSLPTPNIKTYPEF